MNERNVFILGDNENKFFITRVTRRKFNLSILKLDYL